MIQSYSILGPFAWMFFSVPRNHREELKVLHATLLDCWDKGLKLVLLFFPLWHLHIHMISHGLPALHAIYEWYNVYVFVSIFGFAMFVKQYFTLLVTTVTQTSLTQWFDIPKHFLFPWIFCEHCVNTHPFSCRGPDDLLSCTFGEFGRIFSQRTCRIEGDKLALKLTQKI